MLDHLRRLTAAAELPAIRVHDLRHKNVATTIDLYGHLTRDAADDGVTATCAALDAADAMAA
ncbi:hypothetical protein FB565_003123 [Actinoplanes lutulentus]|uniref:Phage integrase family protein n=1 Tax=Actinoplanes lutulentus TaxID=1287878 RepID=A0A327YX01_9ACTN|nr:hypothetical protein [Actinoplanes lutulentus]MBB2943410.1 hypothetical protein [Actinoplanes lutulentus]RAK26071.1 hypothetical protein B0I29_129107 [Actinoplanes lutulentus]